MKTTLKLPLGTFYIYDNYIIVEIAEGITIATKHNKILEDIAEKYFASKDFVYITNRVNSYAVNPAVYKKTSKIKNLVGFAIVASNYIALRNADIEKLFLNKPFESFTELSEAIKWAEAIVDKT
jgi:hypothetical protein